MKKIYLLLAFGLSCYGAVSQPGRLDPSFGGSGYVFMDPGMPRNVVQINPEETLVDPDGRFYVLFTVNNKTFVTRRLANGSLDLSYGRQGYSVPIPFTSPTGVLQSDQKLVVSGDFRRDNKDNFGLARLNVNGFFDSSFDTDGLVVTEFSSKNDQPNDVLIQPDGKILVGGTSGLDLALARYLPDGSLDLSFSGDGKQTTNIYGGGDPYEHISGSEGNAIALAPDGKIVLGGSTQVSRFPHGPELYFVAARYHPDGSLDLTFSEDGTATIITMGGRRREALDVEVQADGKVVLAGSAFDPFLGNDFAIARLTQNGELDGSFSDDGMVITDIAPGTSMDDDVIRAISIQPDGRILAAGYSTAAAHSRFVSARYLPDGTFDNSFSGDGIQFTDLGTGHSKAYDVILMNSGKFVLGGFAFSNGDPAFALARYLANGDLDPTLNGTGKLVDNWRAGVEAFNAVAVQNDGKVVAVGTEVARYLPNGNPDPGFSAGDLQFPGFTGEATGNAVAIQPDGKIIIAGFIPSSTTGFTEFALMRLNPDGSPDPAFSGDGIQITVFPATNGSSEAHSLVLQPDGKIVVAGFAATGAPPASSFAFVRYHPNGALDLSFSGDGIQLVDVGAMSSGYSSHYSRAYSIALQTDGKLVAGGTFNYTLAGQTSDMAYNDFALVRLHPDGSLDHSFDGDGMVMTNLADREALSSIAVQGDGRILAAGHVAYDTPSGPGTQSDFALVRYNTNGSPDPGFSDDGKLILDLGSAREEIRSLALQNDGRIIAGGIIERTDIDMILLRLNTNGSLDQSFGSMGRSMTDLGYSDDEINEIRLHNNRIYAAGTYRTGPSLGLVAAFLNGDASPVMIPAKIEAENWNGMYGVQTEATSDEGGGLNVGYIDYTDWIDYYIDVPAAGKYQIHFRLATPNNNAQFKVTKGNELLSIVHIPQTGSYQSWITHTITVDLMPGPQTLTLTSTGGGSWNLNWLEFTNLPDQDYTHIPALIQAEDWDLMNGVKTETTTDMGGGLNVGYIDFMDYLSYNIHAPSAGLYEVSFRLATLNTNNPQFELRNTAGNVLATVHVPYTGGWQNWTTITVPVMLPAGDQSLYLVSTGGGFWNINWLEFALPVMTTEAKAKPEDVADNTPVVVLPNPSTHSFKLNLGAAKDRKITVRVLNASGGIIEKIETDGGRLIEFGQSYKPGIYFIEVREGNRRVVKKLLKL